MTRSFLILSCFLPIGVASAGCGLVIDFDPEDPDVQEDSGTRDGSTGDGGRADGGSEDGGGPADSGGPDAETDGSIEVDAGPSCEPPCGPEQACCFDGCVHVLDDEANCGFCGNPCEDSEVCVDGLCAECDPTAADTCLNADEPICSASGRCVSACAAGCDGTTCCGDPGLCVDLASDPRNCGDCGRACGANKHCEAGECRCGRTASVLCSPGSTCTIDLLGIGVCL